LLEELEKGEKGLGADGCSYGLTDGEDVMMSNWSAAILGPPHSVHENRIYNLQIHCSASYPDEPPLVKFTSKINLPSVDQNGRVNLSKLARVAQWSRDYTMEKILVALREHMAHPACRKLPQPPEGAEY